MLSLILLTPLTIFIFNCLINAQKSKNLFSVGIFGYAMAMIAVFAIFLKTNIMHNSGKFIYSYKLFNWTTVYGADASFTILLDYVSITMSCTVIAIGILVNLFSMYYMANDPFIVRFFSYLSLFTYCMLILVTSADLIQFFIGWELVGLCSYLLINFWYTRKQANLSSTKAIIVNRVGDFFFMFALAKIFYIFKTTNIQDISQKITICMYNNFEFLDSWDYNIICLFLFFAVMSKSAQIGLHMWLPDAMEGPTPVSALIHAATMVTAGIYLLVRLSILFTACTKVLNFITIVGSLTALLGATTGSVQTDIKKIIAFSTCSQLGYMVSACGLLQYNIAFFHLTTHAFFKSLLFLSAGVVIHTLNGEQDIRKMGGLYKILPITVCTITIASLALSGIPFLSGYYSKELIITSALLSNTWIGFYSGTMLIISAIFTSLYSAKLLYFVFFNKPSLIFSLSNNLHCENLENFRIFQILPLVSLTIFSILVGYTYKDFIGGIGSNSSLNSFFNEYLLKNSKIVWYEYLPLWIKLMLTLCSISGYAYYASLLIIDITVDIIINREIWFQKIHDFFTNRWGIDKVITTYFNNLKLFLLENLKVSVIQQKLYDALFVEVGSSWPDAFSKLKTLSGVYAVCSYITKMLISAKITWWLIGFGKAYYCYCILGL